MDPSSPGYPSTMDPAPASSVEPQAADAAVPHAFAEAVPGLAPGVLLHRSRHADTVRGTWGGRAVVAKRIREDIVDPDERQRAARGILREGLLLRRVSHPSIVRVARLVEHPATLVLELVPGRSMREELRLRRRLPAREAASVGWQLAEALEHLHRRWILHRDVKPANIVYDGHRAVLIDFHLAKEPGPMRGGAGTRLFTAPEQVRGGHVTAAADVWGLGTVLYRAVSGRLPFHATEGHPQLTERPVPVLQRLADSRFGGDLRRAEVDLPRELASLVDRMLSTHPDARPSAAEVAATLRLIAGSDAAA
ncbi:MAG: serine/threonine protein kinase [Thermoleophilia bacterium]|nr:serine/threonine protein kinase [Thermoleophilia bacterium]